MFLIDYVKNKTTISISKTNTFDKEDFYAHVEFLKFINTHYDQESNTWTFSKDRLDEIIMWITKRGFDYSISKELEIYIKESFIPYFKRETTFFRKKVYDPSVIKEGEALLEFQKEGINWRISKSNYLDADDAGLGKSVQNIVVFSSIFKNKEIDGIVIIVPNGLSYHWKYEILKFVNVFTSEDIAIINNENKIQCFSKYSDKKIIIIPNHLISDVLLSYKKKYKKGKSAKHIRWGSVIDIKKEWNKSNMSIVVDESHNIKNSSAIRSKAVMSIKSQFKFRCCLSATPAINRLEDFYNQVSFVDNSIIPMSEKAFILWLANNLGSEYNKYEIRSYNEDHVKEFYANLNLYMIRRLKEDVPEMKAKKIYKETFLELTPLQRDIYRTVTDEEIILLEEEFNEVTFKQVLNKLQIIIEAIDNPLLLKKRSYFNSKLKNLIDKYDIENDSKFQTFSYLIEKYVDYLNGKVVVYGIHPDTLNILCDKFERYKPLIIHGKVNTSEEARQNIQNKFNDSDENKIIFLSALTSSAGINLQKKCNNIIFYELPFDATLTRQALDRTHRINSTKDSVIDFLIYPETIDNVRYLRTMNRINLNDKMNKKISQFELKQMLQGII